MADRDFEGLERRRRRSAQLFAQGATQAEVARRLRVSRTTAREQLHQALIEGPLAWGYENELWTLPRVTEVIHEVTGIAYHPGHVWRVLRQLGWSRQKPTTRARERDEEAIGRWMHETWPGVKKTPRAGARTLSSSTRAASRSGRPSSAPGRRVARPRS
jgi:transposase